MTRFLAVFLLWATAASAQDTRTDPWIQNPADDATFESYLQFFAYSDRVPFDSVRGARSETNGVVRDHLTFTSTPGIRVTAYTYHAAAGGVGGSRRAVILLHGGVAGGKDSRTPGRVAEMLARDGWTVLSLDLLHFGERTTNVLTTFTTQEKAERLYNEPATYLQFVTQTVKDVSRSYDYLTRVEHVDSSRVVLIGFSRGAALGSIAAAADQRLRAVVLLHGGHMGLLVQRHQPAACPANYIGRIAPRPLLMINTASDAYFLSDTQIRPWIALAQQPSVRWVDGPHGFLGDEDLAFVLRWLRTAVP